MLLVDFFSREASTLQRNDDRWRSPNIRHFFQNLSSFQWKTFHLPRIVVRRHLLQPPFHLLVTWKNILRGSSPAAEDSLGRPPRQRGAAPRPPLAPAAARRLRLAGGGRRRARPCGGAAAASPTAGGSQGKGIGPGLGCRHLLCGCLGVLRKPRARACSWFQKISL